MTNEEARAHMDMLIAHKDKALETHPYFKRCDSCTHSEEQDGSNCYECVKGMADNFEEQPKTGYISIDVNKLAKEVAEKALDEITYEGKTVREWVEIIVKQPPCEDCISRAEVRKILGNEVFELTKLHTVNPEDNPKADAMAYGVNWSLNTLMELSSVTPERPKGKWIEVEVHDFYATLKCSVCDRVIEPHFTFGEYSYEDIKAFYPYCHCGAEMEKEYEEVGNDTR